MHIKLRKWVKVILLLIFLAFSLYFYSRYIETKLFKVKEYNIKNINIPNSFYGFKIVHISDIHYKVTTDDEDLKKIVNEINLLKPDIVIFSGDLFDKTIKYTNKDYKKIEELLKNINYNIGKFAIKGDNDLKNDHWNDVIKNSDFTDLNDTYKLIYYKDSEPILLTGLSSNYYDNHVEKLKEIENNYKYSILVLHEPDFADKVNNYNLILAGHSLNGQINIPYIGGIIKEKYSNKYYSEYYKINNSDLYISNGIGTSKYKYRLFNIPSINLYRLRNK